jgi:hypothetical protein
MKGLKGNVAVVNWPARIRGRGTCQAECAVTGTLDAGGLARVIRRNGVGSRLQVSTCEPNCALQAN